MEERRPALPPARRPGCGHYERELAGATAVGTRQGQRAGRRAATRRCSRSSPTSPTPSGCWPADFVSTEDGTGIVHMAPALRRGGPERLRRRRHRRRSARWTRGAASPPRCPPCAGLHVFDANRRSSAPSRRRARSSATRRYRPLLPALLALRQPAHLPRRVVLVRGRSPSSATAWSSSTSRSAGCPSTSTTAVRQVARERARLVDQPQPLLGLADPGLEVATTRATRASTCTARSTTSSATSACGHRPAPSVHRRAHPAEPGRPDRQVDDAPRARGARLLVRVRLDAVRPGALPVREQGRGSSTTTPATSSSSTSARRAAGSTRCTCWRRRCSTGPRSGRASPTASCSATTGRRCRSRAQNYPDVREVFDRYGSDAMRWFLMASPDPAWRRPDRDRAGHPRPRAPGADAAVEHVLLPRVVRERREHGRRRPHGLDGTSSTATSWPRRTSW